MKKSTCLPMKGKQADSPSAILHTQLLAVTLKALRTERKRCCGNAEQAKAQGLEAIQARWVKVQNQCELAHSALLVLLVNLPGGQL